MELDSQIKQLTDAAIRDQVFPGCAVGYVHDGQTTVKGYGHLTYDAGAPAVTPETVYDVASITKPIPTGTLVHMLVEEGQLSYDDAVITYVPEIRNEYRDQILIRHLLTYTVILDLQTGLGASARAGVDELKDVLFESPLQAPPGEKYHYTNTPAIWLGLVVERILGIPLDQAAKQRLFAPLDMTSSTFAPEDLPQASIAPTEIDWRGTVQGVVHDEAAWALHQAGQVAGNAGLFSTAPDLLIFLQMLLDGGTWKGKAYLKPETITLMHTNQLAGLGEHGGLGWEMGQAWFMGTKVSASAFGKTGFTGGYLLIDPEKDAALVFLTNRTWPKRPESREKIHEFRRSLSDLVFA